jgi:hypothetical protein
MNLYERASDCIDYFESKLPATLIEQAIDSGDEKELERLVLDAEATMSLEYYGNKGDI